MGEQRDRDKAGEDDDGSFLSEQAKRWSGELGLRVTPGAGYGCGSNPSWKPWFTRVVFEQQ